MPSTIGLADLLAPITLEQFFQNDYGRRPVIVRGSPEKVDGLLTWADLNAALRATHLEWLAPEREGAWPRDRVMTSVRGDILDPTEFFTEVESLRRNRVRRLDPQRLTSTLRRRATLLVKEIDFLVDSVADLAAQLELDLGDPVSITALASFTPTPGLDSHIDEQDGLVLQIYGRKRWRMWEPTRRDPVHNDVSTAPRPLGDPVIDVVLNAGDVAYLPRGWFHAVAALEEPSLHLTVNIYKRTGVDLAAWLFRRLRDDARVRADVPRHADADARAAYGRHVAAAIDAALGEGTHLIDDFLHDWDTSAAPRRPTFSLPWSAVPSPPDRPDLRLRLLAPRGLGAIDTSAGTVRFTVADRPWEFTAAQFAALTPLLDGCSATLADLRAHAAGLSAREVDVLIQDLLLAGLLEAAEPQQDR
jgi:ribosomal protein L16 Arg81 hydroxylase